MSYLLTLTYLGRDDEMHYGVWPALKVAEMHEADARMRGPIAAIRQAGGRDIRLDVTDDVTGGCVLRFRMRGAA